jgi:ABC-type transport system substrate-binding protein
MSAGDDYLKRALEREITRRRFLGRLGLGGLALLSGGGLLAACGGDGDDGEAAPPAPPGTTGAATTGAATTAAATGAAETVAGEPVRGGTLIFSASSTPFGFDPARWFNTLSATGVFALFDPLLSLAWTENGEVGPGIAELPEVNAEGTLYTFALRPGVMFHHGREMTADDVKFTLERVVDPATASEAGSYYQTLGIVGTEDVLNERSKELTGVTVVDPLTLTVELEQPDSAFLYLLGLPFTGVVPRDVVEELGNDGFNLAPVGTGPFKLSEPITLDESFVLERNTDYWDPERPYVDQVEWNTGIDGELAHLRIQDGEQDVTHDLVPSGVLSQVLDNPDIEAQLITALVSDVYYITLNLEHEATKDLRVRQAIAHAIDKERLIRVLKGLGQPADGGLFSPLGPYYQQGMAYPYDPDAARQLLADAGFADGFDIDFFSRNTSPSAELSETAQEDLRTIGINANLQQLAFEPYGTEVVKNPPALTENQWQQPYPHGSFVIDSAFTQASLDAGCCNFSEYVDPEFEQLVVDAHRATDPNEVIDLYKQMDEIVVKTEALWVPVLYPEAAALISERTRGFKLPTVSEYRFFADYWLEEA